jgi:hypothetical protein
MGEKSPPWSDIGYHYGLELINDEYEILLGRMGDRRGAHCIGMNQKSLGVMFCGDFTHKAPSPELWSMGIKLIHSLKRIYNISAKNVIGHREHAANQTCPGGMFDLGHFRADLKLLEDICNG